MSDPGRRQQDRPGPAQPRPGQVPTGAAPGGAPPGRPPGAGAGYPPAYGAGRGGGQRYPAQQAGPQYHNPGPLRTGPAPGGARPPVPLGPGGAPGQRGRPADPRATGPQRPRPPAGPAGAYPTRVPAGPMPVAPQRKTKRRLLVWDVRTRRVLRKLDIWSIFKVSFIFYLCVLVVLVAAGVVVWNVAATFGVINSIDKSVRSLFALKSFELHPTNALIWGTIVCALLCFLGVLVNTMAALFYNLISDLVGGVQVVALSESQYAAKRSSARDDPLLADGPTASATVAVQPANAGTSPTTATLPNGTSRAAAPGGRQGTSV